MSEYMLTDKQKTLLRLLVPHLERGELETEWTILESNDGLRISGLSRHKQLLEEGWKDTRPADILAFVRCRFLETIWVKGPQSRYALNEARIVNAVQNDFVIPDVSASISIGDNFSGQLAIGDQNVQVQKVHDTIRNLRELFDDLGLNDPVLSALLDEAEQNPSEENLKTLLPKAAYKATEIMSNMGGATSALIVVYQFVQAIAKLAR